MAQANLETDEQKLSYIFGIQVGQNLASEDMEVDMDAFTAGVNDMLEGKEPQLNKADAEKIIGEYQKKKSDELAAVMNEKQQEAQAYMEKNAQNEGVKTTESGIQYEVIREGDGAIPNEDDTVIADYEGTLIDGTKFDSSYDRGEPATFPVNGVIKGWQEVLQMMKEGAKWRVVIPGNLAYGPQGAGDKIGPNETLIFDIELIAITE